MDPLTEIVEKRIQEAMDRGEFERLPGAGQPLHLEDDPLVPEELRVAYRLLKNAGFLPPEVLARAEIASAEALLAAASDPAERNAALRRWELLRLRLDQDSRQRRANLAVEREYFDLLVARFEKRS
jgi:hypothetical protein